MIIKEEEVEVTSKKSLYGIPIRMRVCYNKKIGEYVLSYPNKFLYETTFTEETIRDMQQILNKYNRRAKNDKKSR